MNICPNSAELNRAITNSLEYQQRMLAAGGTILPCVPLRQSWWRKAWRRLASLASISSRN